MSIELRPEEGELLTQINERMAVARKGFAESRIDDAVQRAILEAGDRAHLLHMLLKSRGLEPKHHAYMIKNRGVQPDDPEFYLHFHPIEDLLRFLQNEEANDDPIDQTIGADFTFRLFSRRWGHEDEYKISRTADGWAVTHIMVGGECDKGGRPFLFENLQHDFIQYPEGLDGWLEWLWNRAADQGLTSEQVQTGLQQLADWVSETERHSPNGGIWEGY